MPEIRANTGLLTALAERWHSETSSFHLATGEATGTLEDVWRILRIPIHGEMIEYDPVTGRDTLCSLFECNTDDLDIVEREIGWESMAAEYDRRYVVIAVVIACLLAGDRRGHGFPIGWGRVLERMVTEGTVYAWGPCVLAMLYF